MIVAIVAGAVAQALAWIVTRRRGTTIWATTAPVLGVAGAVAAVVARPALSGDVGGALAVGVGIVTGVALYGATFAFVRIAGQRWRAFDVQARDAYEDRSGLPPVAAIAIAAGVAAVGEEVFWRGLVLEWATGAFGSTLEAGVACWLGYSLVNVASANLAIVAGAVVGGAVWTLLAAWSGGVLASTACHACWTSLMIAHPVIAEPSAS